VGGGFFDSNFYPFFFQWVDLYPDYTAQINIYDYSPEKHGVLKAWIRKIISALSRLTRFSGVMVSMK